MSCARIHFITLKPGTFDKAGSIAESGLGPLMQQQPGFIEYFLVNAGGNKSVSVSVWDNERQMKAADVKIKDWIERNTRQYIVSEEMHDGDLMYRFEANEPSLRARTTAEQPEARH
jgi:heme-degrading monooxygenase HmoA